MRKEAANGEVIASGDVAVEVQLSAFEEDRCRRGGGCDLGNRCDVENSFGSHRRGCGIVGVATESS